MDLHDDRIWGGFLSEFSKLSVSDLEALEAAKTISESPRSRARKYTDASVVGGALKPAVDAAGSFAKGYTEAKGGARLRAGHAAVKAFGRGDMAKSVTTGALGGAMIQAGREGLQAHHAKKTVHEFLREHGEG